MYPKNSASPPTIAVGSIYLIADGTIQTSGASVRVITAGGAWGAGGGTLGYDATSGAITYIPTQAETNGEWFIVCVYKASCTSASVTVVTTASATAGTVKPADGSIVTATFGTCVTPETTKTALLPAVAAGAKSGLPILDASTGLILTGYGSGAVTVSPTASSIVTGSFGTCVLPETTKTNLLPAVAAGAKSGLPILDASTGLILTGYGAGAVTTSPTAGSIVTASFGTCVPPAPSGMSTLTQSQVSGGAYDLTNATFISALKSGLGTIPASGNWETTGAAAAALVAVNLDHLVGTATDIPTLPAGTYLDQAIRDGTATYDRTTDSLQAIRDSGSGGLDAAGVRAALGMSPADLDTQLDAILAASTPAGGTYTQTATVTCGGVAVQGVLVSILDAADDSVIDYATTNVSGVAVVRCNAMSVKFTAYKLGYTSYTSAATSVTAAAARAVTLTAIAITPSAPGYTTLWATVYDEEGDVEAGVTITCRMVTAATGTGSIFDFARRSEVSDAAGLVQFTQCVQGAVYSVCRGTKCLSVTVGTSATQGIGNFGGSDA